jgi:AAA family ATP:ADP antiporter
MASAHGAVLPPARPGILDRILSISTKVEPGEGGTAVLLALNVFLLLGGYYVLKTVRDALILAEAGAEVKSYTAAGQVLIFALFIPIYGAVASRVGRLALVAGSTLFFVSHLALFFVLATSGVHIGVAFYLWLGVFNMFVVAQFWGFANDIYTEDQGKRLFPAIGIGASLGAWTGSVFTKTMFKTFGANGMLLLGAAVFCVCVALTLIVNRREGAPSRQKKAEEPLDKKGGFPLVIGSPYLRWMAVAVLLLNLVNTTGEYLIGRFVVEEAVRAVGAGEAFVEQRTTFIGQFYGDYYSWVNLAGLIIQTLLVSRVFQWIGVRGALFILPSIAMFGYLTLLVAPILAVLKVSKIFENATDYSLNNTVRHALFLPTSREAKYKAKAAIDTFFVRTGDLGQAGIVFAGVQMGLTVGQFAGIVLSFVALWFYANSRIAREHKQFDRPAQA